MNATTRDRSRRLLKVAGASALAASLFALAAPADPALASIGTSTGDIIVTDFLDDDVIKVNPATGAQSVVSAGGFIDFATSVAVAANGDILVGNHGLAQNLQPARIVRIDHVTGQRQVMFEDFFFEMSDLTVAADGGIIAVGIDGAQAEVLRIDPVTRAETVISALGELRDPHDVAIESDGSILVADQLGSDGTPALVRVSPNRGLQEVVTSFGGANGLALERDGSILLADTVNKALLRINPVTGGKTTVATGDRIADIGAMAVEANGSVVAMSFDRSTSQDGVLRINPITGASSFVARGGNIQNGGGIAVVGVNEIPPSPDPVANADVYSFSATTGIAVVASGVLANDSDPQGDPLKARLVSAPTHGLFSLHPDGSFEYVGNSGFVGIDKFTYRALDPAGHISAIVPVTLKALSGVAPRAGDDSFSFAQGTNVSIPAPGVLSNDTDPNGDPLRAKVVTQPSHGLLSLSSDGAIDYAVNPGFIGTDSFTYTASDGSNSSNIATVRLTFTGSPSLSVQPGGSCNNTSGRAGTVKLRLIDADTPIGNLTLKAKATTNPGLLPLANVTFAGTGSDRTVTTTVAPGATGSATLSVTVSDGTDTRTIVIIVQAGGASADALTGTGVTDVLLGQGGKDTLSGLGGNDLLCGGGESDLLTGGTGADRFSGGAGTDTVTDFATLDGDTKDATTP